MNQFHPRKKGYFRLVPDEPKSILTMTDDELNKIDRFQDMNRGFGDTHIPDENIEIN